MPFPADPLVSSADLEGEVGGSLLLWCQSTDPEVRTQAGLAIAQAHTQLLAELKDLLPDLFRDLSGSTLFNWTETGYSLTYLDGVLSLLANPEVLKSWEGALALFWLSNNMIGRFQIVGSEVIAVMVDQRTFWGGKDGTGGQANVRKLRGLKDLRLKPSSPGATTDFDRVRVQGRILRV
jgi:hypothetical protein